ncbi:dienelactone hydrolase family protein [Nocardiopsis salina]|uniref:dienelactone hydrolase family protein n=1 Tax=Nocardiopsis salina TaxID=245836 RepID=UPI000344FB77|nr:dienelactone hydrolase family protein [Nocardiopsis salina]
MSDHEHSHTHAHGPANRGRRVLKTAAPLFVREPDGPPRGGAIVLHDVFGVSEYVEEYCRRLAAEGWLAVAPYLYYEYGGRDFRPEQLSTARAAMDSLGPDDLAADIDGAVDHLVRRCGLDAARCTATGFSMGGYLATWAAGRHALGAAVAVSPGGVEQAPWPGLPHLSELVAQRLTPWLGIAPDGDPALDEAVSGVPCVQTESVGPVAHGFYRLGREHHDPEAERRAWSLAEAFTEAQVAGAPPSSMEFLPG